MTASSARGDGLRVVGVGDTDSYVKWGAALLGRGPAGWARQFVILQTPVTLSEQQQSAALAGSHLAPQQVMRSTLEDFQRMLESDPPDVVLIAARGPLARVIARAVATLEPRPVIATGLPGISIPGTRKALLFRTQCDLFVLHSHREIAEFARLADAQQLDARFALASLPFAVRARRGDDRPAGGTDLVFAAQAIVPATRAEREHVARLLVRAAAADPTRRVVLKLRGVKGEHQTHAEAMPIADLIDAVGETPSNLVISTEPMRDALADAAGLVTVSSTAAIEALALGVPVIALDSFGVSPELINEVFTGSGLYGGDDDVVHRRFRQPHEAWVRANYLHDAADDDWAEQLAALVDLRRRGALALRPPLRRRGGGLRDRWERKLVLGRYDRSLVGFVAMVVGLPLRAAVRVAQRVRRALMTPTADIATRKLSAPR